MPQAVLVTTDNRGVFFGYLEDNNGPESVILADARNIIKWDDQVHGYLGLAATGPTPRCQVGPKVPRCTLYAVTTVTECTPEAVTAWESEPWGR